MESFYFWNCFEYELKTKRNPAKSDVSSQQCTLFSVFPNIQQNMLHNEVKNWLGLNHIVSHNVPELPSCEVKNQLIFYDEH